MSGESSGDHTVNPNVLTTSQTVHLPPGQVSRYLQISFVVQLPQQEFHLRQEPALKAGSGLDYLLRKSSKPQPAFEAHKEDHKKDDEE